MMRSYVSIDLETTGLDPKRDKITEIGAVKFIRGERRETFSTLVNPGRRLEQRVVELTGLTDADLAGAPYIEEVLPEIIGFLGDLPLLGHSVLFDFSFLKKAAVNAGLTFERHAVDTLKIARKYLADLEHRSLDYLCAYYKIPHQAHRALPDAEATAALYACLAEHFFTEEETLFQPQPLVYQAKRDTPATKPQKEGLCRLAEQHGLDLNVDIEKLTRSEASRLTDRILSRYGRGLRAGGPR